MSDDDTFTGGVAGHVRRIAERREAERQRMEEQGNHEMKAIGHRLVTLERKRNNPAGMLLYAFADGDETADQAIARQYPDGTPESATVTVLRWSDGR
jgi:hypothetical protein